MDDFDVADATQGPSQPTRRFNAIRPVTIRQLTQTKVREELTRNGSEFRYSLDGDEFYMVTFVGNIIDIVVSGENTRTIRIEDGTAKVTSTLTIKKDQEAEDPPKWRAGAYARVFGVPREFNEAVVFSIYFIRPIDDPYEVFFHLMEAIVVTLQRSRGQPPPRLYDSNFAKTAGLPLPQLTADPDLSTSMRSLVLNPPPLRSQPLPVASTSQVTNDPCEDSNDSVKAEPPDSTRGDTSDDDDGSTEYYTDQPPDSPLEHSPSPMYPFARNHSHEGHLGHEEGSSSQSSQSTQRSMVLSSDEEGEDGRTPRRKYKLRGRDDVAPRSQKKGSDDELEVLRSELSSQIVPSTPPRKLKADPYSGWSPAKRNIMVFIQTKSPGEEVDIRRALGGGTPKLEMRKAVRELVKEGEIESVDGINYRLTDKGPKYPRF